MQVRVTENPEEIGKCGCGRSPSGKCIGWHALTDEQWLEGKVQLEHAFKAGQITPLPTQEADDEVA